MLNVHARLLVAGAPVDGGIRASRRTCAPCGGALRAGGRGARRGGLAVPHGLLLTPPDRGKSCPGYPGLVARSALVAASGESGAVRLVFPASCCLVSAARRWP